ncbi:MAG: diguanylate cyclase, partial [Candidatus Omnitrophota bacterium]
MDNKKPLNSQETDLPFVSRLLYQMIDEKYRIFLDESSDLMCITDRDGKFIYVNKKLVDSLGFTKKEMLGLHMADIVASESRSLFAEKTREFLKNGKMKIDGFVLKTKYKGRIVGEMNSIAFFDNAGKYCGAKAIFKDRTRYLEMEQLEKKYESMMEDGIGSLDYIVLILDKGLKVRWVSASIQKYFGLDKLAIIGEDMRQILENKIRPLMHQEEVFLSKLLSAYDANETIESFECQILSEDGGERYDMEHWSYPITHGDLNGGRIEIYRDITARKKSEETMEYYYKKIHAIMEHAVEGIVELRTDNTIEFVNKSFLEMLGYTEMDMLNKVLSDFILPDDRSRLVSIKLIRKAREVAFLKKDGSLLYALVSSIPLVFGTHPPHALCFISDITETKMASQKLRDANLTLRALNDSLLDLSLRDVRTGAYNYRYLSERLSEEIKRARRYFRPISLIMMDIDFFKTINDSYGHLFGDVILREFTDLLKGTVRETDIIVRSGGEEFVVFLSDTDTLGALRVAQKIVRTLKEIPLGDEKRKISITVSIGIASYPEIGLSEPGALLDAADQAMYQSKNDGRNKITVFNASVTAVEPQTGMIDDLSVFQHLEDRLKNINLRNEASVLESMMPMVREVDKREGYTHGHTERLAKE